MAISHDQPLFLLLVSLCFSPALCQTFFQTCNTAHQYPIKVSNVKISPDPVVRSRNGNITITGLTDKAIPNGVTVNLRLSITTIYTVSVKSYSLCDITACPVAPGPIVLNFSNIFTPKEKKTAIGYTVIINIVDKAQKEKMMCIGFNIKLRSW